MPGFLFPDMRLRNTTDKEKMERADADLGPIPDRPVSDGEDARIIVQRRNVQLQAPVPRLAGGPYRDIATTGPDIQERVTACRIQNHRGENMFAQQRPARAEKKVDPSELPDGPVQSVRIRVRPVHDFLIGRVPESQLRKEKVRHQRFNSFS